MIIPFGTKHKGDKVGKVLLKDPDYIVWMLDQQGTGAMGAVQTEAKRLIAKLDAKPLTVSCHGCKGQATYFTGYHNNASLMYPWCDVCEPYSNGANQGKLVSIRTFLQAMNHVKQSCGNTKGERTAIVKTMAQAKGLPKHIGDAQVDAFFV